MSEGWPAQVVNESGVMESDAAAEASQVAGKVSEAVKSSAHAVQGAVAGVCQCPRSPPPRQPKSNSPPAQSLTFCFHLYVFPLTCTAVLQLESYSAVRGYIHHHSLQAQTGKACSHDQATCC